MVAACASPEVVDERQVGDQDLSCAELEREIAAAQEFEEKARDERGATGTNVAAALLFAPALGATYMNTEEAIDAAEERQDHLLRIYDAKEC